MGFTMKVIDEIIKPHSQFKTDFKEVGHIKPRLKSFTACPLELQMAIVLKIN
jgi:hypothetical protein